MALLPSEGKCALCGKFHARGSISRLGRYAGWLTGYTNEWNEFVILEGSVAASKNSKKQQILSG